MSDLLVWNELGNIYFRIGACEEAMAVYEKAIEEAPAFGWPYSNLGLVYAHQGKYAQAIPLYRKSIELLKTDRDRAIAWNRMGDAYRRMGDPKNAMSAYQKAVQLDVGELEKSVFPAIQAGTAPQPDPGDSDGSLGGPMDDLKAVEHTPPFPTRVSEPDAPRIEMAEWLRQLEGEREPVTDGIGTEDRELQEWLRNSVGATPAKEGSPAAAQPGRGETHYWVIDTHRPGPAQPATTALTKWVPQAVACTQPAALPAAAEVDVLEPPARFMMLVKGVPAEAAAPAAPAVEAKPQTGRLADAAAAYAKITAATPGNDRAWDALGNSLRALGRYDEAVAAFEQAIACCPGNEEYHYHLGLVYAAQAKHEQAVQAFQRAVELNPDYILAHCGLAGSYRRLGREAEAMQHIRAAGPAIEAEKEYNRACFEVMCGNVEKALDLLKVALVTKQTPVEWMRSDPDLEGLRADPRFLALLEQQA
jgi:tetratricopeptide (TPR) repeat protein